MTHKEISERLREIADARTYTIHTRQAVRSLADELDPPRPEPGTVVWWSYANDTGRKYLGYISDGQHGVVPLNEEHGFDDYYIRFEQIEWKPARILGTNEVAVKVPPVSEWPKMADEADLRWHYGTGTIPPYANVTITRAEAERMESER